MIQAVFDANVFASGVLGYRREESTPGALLRRWFSRDFELITSDPLIAEIERALNKPHFVARVESADRRLTLQALREQAIRTAITVAVAGVASHPEDDLVLAAATSAAAVYLVTGDKQLQEVGSFRGVQIVSPRDFLTILEQDKTAADDIDPLAILAELGLGDPAAVEIVRGGADAAIWRVEHAGQRFALRVLRPDQTDQARREVAAMRTAADGGVPVPGVVATATWHDRPALLLTWNSGRPLAEALLAGPADLSRIRSLGVAFGRVQSAIHALPVPDDLPPSAVFSEASMTTEPALAARLALEPERPPALIHLDYHPLNVLVEGERVTAVLDWANARTGDRRADLARTLAIVRLAPLPAEIPAETGRAALRAFESGWRHGYEEVAGPVGELAPFCWWAGVMMERELAPRVGRPDIPWLTPAYLNRVRRWTGGWRARATRRR